MNSPDAEYYRRSLHLVYGKMLALTKYIQDTNLTGARLKNEQLPSSPTVTIPEIITKRDLTVARHLADGLSHYQIAQKEGVTSRGVDGWTRFLYKKMGVVNAAQLVALFLRNGWIT